MFSPAMFEPVCTLRSATSACVVIATLATLLSCEVSAVDACAWFVTFGSAAVPEATL